ncbi:MAG TPA: DNA cytosine methyltransferase [Gemmatimonadaceae bacterium]|nr:DNA cytosine methyltransferase [Gemmatimonadaceae bacterium]
MTRKRSYLTVTDQFCGAGGSSIGATAAGLEIRMAMNHWALAVETHNTNFPNADHDCADISASDPRRYPSTDILITSPECTTHSPAGGNRHRKPQQRDLFSPHVEDAATQRSRATMWDVVRFAEYHQYRAIIVENVVEVVRQWVLFPTWWSAMENLGYVGQMVCLNSMFAHPTPQSRDRLYVVWTKKGNRRPDLDITPRAHCPTCGDVDARQSFKAGRRVGKYGARNQYVYTCPVCRNVVAPYYFCALNALDLSIPAERIGDRKRALQPRTMERVRYGLEKYGRRPLQVTVNNISGVGCRVRGMDDSLFTQTGSGTTALVAPWLVALSQTSKPAAARVRSTAGPMAAQTTADDLAIAGFNPYLITNRTNCMGRALDGAIPTVATGGHHGLVQPAALLRLMGDLAVSPLDKELPTQTAGDAQNMLLQRSPFLVQYYGTNNVSSVDEGVPTCTAKDRHALVTPGSIDIDDCYFRMLAPHEIGRAMAFPDTYTVLGKKGEKVKQYGNAVTPPAMAILIERVVESLHRERGRTAA